MSYGLVDLDELILKCRSEEARGHIAEAVASYRGGAYRAAIVSTWIGICFDIISKFRELALAGDKAAEQKVEELERIRKSHDPSAALGFEKKLLVVARDTLELISPLEFDDLLRVQEDRNRCAHPSLSAEGEFFAPPAELARLHIYSAVNHLLQHEPAQGKFALDRLIPQVQFDYFPTKTDGAYEVLVAGPLARARESLVRNYIVILLKDLMKKGQQAELQSRCMAALSATRRIHPALSERFLRENLSSIMNRVEDNDLAEAVDQLRHIEDSWSFLDAAQRTRISTWAENLPRRDFFHIEFLLFYKAIERQLLKRISRADFETLASGAYIWMPEEVLERVLQLYRAAPNFDVANQIADFLKLYISDMTDDAVVNIVNSAAGNHEVRASFRFPELLNRLRASQKLTPGIVGDALKRHGLVDFLTAGEE